MNRSMRALPNMLAFCLIAAACGAQSSPDRAAFAIPDVIVPDSLVPTDPLTVFPDTTECMIGVGRGVRLLVVEVGSAAEGALHAGDIVASVDGVPIGSQEQMRSILSGKSADEVVTFAGTRSAEPFSVDVSIRLAADGSGDVDLGLIVETRLEAVPPSESDTAHPSSRFTRAVVLDGEIYLHEPVGGSWSAYDGIPTQSMAAFRGELFGIAGSDPQSLVKIGQGETIPIVSELFTLTENGLPLAIETISFFGVLASVGDLLVVQGGASPADQDVIVSMLFGVDPTAQEVVWRTPFTLSATGNLQIPISGYRSPDGALVAVGVVERDPVTNATSDLVSYTLYDESGASFSILGADQLPSSARVTGWFDDKSLAYVIPTETPRLFAWNVETGVHAVLVGLGADDAVGLRTIEPVGDGRHAVVVYEAVTRLIDAIETIVRRVSSQGCQYVPVGGLTG